MKLKLGHAQASLNSRTAPKIWDYPSGSGMIGRYTLHWVVPCVASVGAIPHMVYAHTLYKYYTVQCVIINHKLFCPNNSAK